MSDFSALPQKIHNLKDAQHLLENFRILYQDAKTVQTLLARYQSDPAYKTAVDYLFAADQRQELAAMIGQVNSLLTEWEVEHPSLIGLDE